MNKARQVCTRCIKWFSLNVILLVILVGVAVFYLVPVKVLNPWNIVVKAEAAKVGEPLTFMSAYTKHFNVPAASERYLQCVTPAGLVDYPLSFNYPSNPPGQAKVTTDTIIPTVPTRLPTKCRIHIKVQYLLFRTYVGAFTFGKPVAQSNVSNWFMVNP